MSIGNIVIIFSFAAGWAAFTWWTVKRLWRSPKEPEDAWFANAVKLGGVAITGFSAFYLPMEIPMPRFEYWQLVAYWGFMSFPVVLWAVYFGTLVFRAFVDNRDL